MPKPSFSQQLLKPTPKQPKRHLLAAGEITNAPELRKNALARPNGRTKKPARSTLKRDSEVSRKLAALPRPLKPPGRT